MPPVLSHLVFIQCMGCGKEFGRVIRKTSHGQHIARSDYGVCSRKCQKNKRLNVASVWAREAQDLLKIALSKT